MSLPANIDDYQLNLFASIDEMREKMLPEHVVKRLLRLRALYTFWLNYPQKSSREILKYDLDMNADIKQREAYDDVRLLKILIGNIEKESKEWHRHVFNQRTEEVYKKAMAAQDFRSAVLLKLMLYLLITAILNRSLLSRLMILLLSASSLLKDFVIRLLSLKRGSVQIWNIRILLK